MNALANMQEKEIFLRSFFENSFFENTLFGTSLFDQKAEHKVAKNLKKLDKAHAKTSKQKT